MLDAVRDLWRAYKKCVNKQDIDSAANVVVGFKYIKGMVQVATTDLLPGSQKDDATIK